MSSEVAAVTSFPVLHDSSGADGSNGCVGASLTENGAPPVAAGIP